MEQCLLQAFYQHPRRRHQWVHGTSNPYFEEPLGLADTRWVELCTNSENLCLWTNKENGSAAMRIPERQEDPRLKLTRELKRNREKEGHSSNNSASGFASSKKNNNNRRGCRRGGVARLKRESRLNFQSHASLRFNPAFLPFGDPTACRPGRFSLSHESRA